jgi:hypothetical protein
MRSGAGAVTGLSSELVERVHYPSLVMAGLVPAIHVLFAAKTWMPGTRPGMTRGNTVNCCRSQRGLPYRYSIGSQ